MVPTETEWMLAQFPRDYFGYAVEVGAYDGQNGSLMIDMEKYGWKVLAIDANPDFEPSLKLWRELYRICAVTDYDGHAIFNVHTNDPTSYSALRPSLDHPMWKPDPKAEFKSVRVPARRLDSLLAEVEFPSLDAACIDVEGGEMEVLRGFDIDRWKPKVVILESWEDHGPTEAFMLEHGYTRAFRRSVNDCYLRNE